jgi:outer membrane receptor protein involved in Fe transport
MLVEAQYGDTEHGGGETSYLAAAFGRNYADGAGNLMLSLTYNKVDPIYANQRHYADDELNYVANPATATDPTAPAYITVPNARTAIYNQTASPLIITQIGSNAPYTLTFTPDGQLTAFGTGTRLYNAAGQWTGRATGCDDCIVNEDSSISNGIDQYGGELQWRHDLYSGDGPIRSLTAFAEAKYYHSESQQQAYYGTFAGSGSSSSQRGSYRINIDNAYIPTDLRTQMASAGLSYIEVTRLDNDFGFLTYDAEYDLQRYVVGVEGEFANGWRFQNYANYGQTASTFTNLDRSESRFREQIDAVVGPNGTIVCRSTLTDPDNGCVPMNLIGVGVASAEAIAYSYQYDVEEDLIRQWNALASVDGDLFTWTSPINGEAMTVSFAAGLEYRREASEAVPDALQIANDSFNGARQITRGSYSTREAFVEVSVPLLSNLPLIQSFELDGSYRYQDYTTTGGDSSYSVSGAWAVNPDLKFRGAYAHAVRAPNVNELFAGGNTTFSSVSDPCDATQVNLGNAPANRLANCRALLGTAAGGMSYTYVQSPTAKAIVTQGNVDLLPETATTWTAGLVFTPRAVSGLTFTADAYKIEIEDAIASLQVSQIVSNCVDSASIDNSFCGSVVRNADGNIATVYQQVLNVASFTAEGVDFGAGYAFDLGGGRLALGVNGSYLETLKYEPIAGDPTTTDNRDGEVANPRFRATMSADWTLDRLSLNWKSRFVGRTHRDDDDYSNAYDVDTTGYYWEHDARVNFRTDRGTLYAGVNNLFDEEPPYTAFSYGGYGRTGLYSVTGRYAFVGFSAAF